VSEAGLPGYELVTWWGIAVPAGTPQALIATLNNEIVQVMALPDVKELLATQGAESRTTTPEQFSDYIKSQIDFYGKIIAGAGIKPE